MGMKAVYLGETGDRMSDDSITTAIGHLNITDIADGEADIVFTSPEKILGHHRDLVCEMDKGKHLKAIFIDEAHCILKL